MLIHRTIAQSFVEVFGNLRYVMDTPELNDAVATDQLSEEKPTALSKGERKKQRREEKQRRQEEEAKARRQTQTFKKIALWTPVGLVLVGVGWLIVTAVRSPESPDLVSRRGIHWHPELTIFVKGQSVDIPANIGVSGAGHKDMHTHKVNDQIHVEMNRAVRQDDIRLGKFFAIWGKQFNSRCVVDTCSDTEGAVTMTVNGQPNAEFENYLMQDKDKIEIRYE